MNYAANVSGGANHSYGGGSCGTGFNVSWILVLFILLVIISCVC